MEESSGKQLMPHGGLIHRMHMRVSERTPGPGNPVGRTVGETILRRTSRTAVGESFELGKTSEPGLEAKRAPLRGREEKSMLTADNGMNADGALGLS